MRVSPSCNLRQTYETCKPLMSCAPRFVSKLTPLETANACSEPVPTSRCIYHTRHHWFCGPPKFLTDVVNAMGQFIRYSQIPRHIQCPAKPRRTGIGLVVYDQEFANACHSYRRKCGKVSFISGIDQIVDHIIELGAVNLRNWWDPTRHSTHCNITRERHRRYPTHPQRSVSYHIRRRNAHNARLPQAGGGREPPRASSRNLPVLRLE
jgi:hypothetical protein